MQFFNLSLFGVSPNFVIIAISAVSIFMRDIWEGMFIVSLVSFILKFSPNFNSEILIFFVLGILIMMASKYLPWNYFINGIFLIAIFSLILYVFLAPAKIISVVFFQEIFYNVLIGGLVISLMKKIAKNE